jgi:2-iminobutanoate/2-iminopropanoate deaminase
MELDESIMKHKPIIATDAPPPVSKYCEAIEVTDVKRLLLISAQTPTSVAGDVPIDFRAQARQVWANIQAQLRAADMGLDNLVKITVYLADRRFGPIHREIREEILGGRTIGLTVVIANMLDERHLLEVEGVAAA